MSTKTHSLIKSQILIASAEGHFLITSLQVHVLACMSIITSVHIITVQIITVQFGELLKSLVIAIIYHH